MKKIIPWKTIVLVLTLAQMAQGQESLPEICFVPDPQFGTSVDWDKSLPPTRATESAVDYYYNLAVADDGRLFLIERDTKSILRFDAQGRYLGRFGGEGRKAHQFYNVPPNRVEVVGDRYVVVNANQWGRLALFSLEGRHLRNIFLDYPISDFRVLADGRLLIKGWILLEGGGSRDHISILDLDTKQTETITAVDHEKKQASVMIHVPDLDSQIIVEYPRNSSSRTYILVTEDNGILVSRSSTPKILRYEGTKPTGTFTLSLARPPVTPRDRGQYQQSLKASLRRAELPDSLVGPIMKTANTDLIPSSQPYYYHLCILPDQRLLAFKLHNGEERLCLVMRMEGQWQSLGDHILKIEGYDPPFLSGGYSHLAFKNGWLYALVTKTEGRMKHFRIIRAKEKP